MRQIRVLTATVMLVLAAMAATSVARADAPRKVVNRGEWMRVSWSTRVNGKSAVGYLSASRLVDGSVYVYFVTQVSGQGQATGWGVLPGKTLTKVTGKDYRLSVSASQMAALTLDGTAPGSLTVQWHNNAKSLAVNVGASGVVAGKVTQVTSGQWTSAAASATGTLLSMAVCNPQTAEMGFANKATQEFQLRH